MFNNVRNSLNLMKVLHSIAGSGIHILEAVTIICGTDINICICGGTHHHVGACALAIPRPSLQDDSKLSASVSVITATGHKEDEMVREIAYKLASAYNCRVSASAGVHIDNATQDDIKLLLNNFQEILDKVIIQIKTSLLEA